MTDTAPLTDELPDGWTVVKLAGVVEDAQGGFASGKKDVAGGVIHLRMNNIGEEGELVLDLLRTVPPDLARDHHRLSRDDVLVCTTNSGRLVGKCALFRLEGDFAFSNHVTRLRPVQALIDPSFLRWWLWATWRVGSYQPLCQHWVNQSTLPKEALLDIPVTLPPLAEQQRIVTKVEMVLARVTAASGRLAKVPTILKRFRQSVLAAACSGRLTVDWRRDRGQPEGEGDELPATWTVATVAEVIEGLKYGTSQKCDYSGTGTPVLRIPNIGDGVIDRSDLKYAALDQREYGQLRLIPGDVLMVRSNGSVSLLGKAALVRAEDEGCAYAGYLIRLRPNREAVLPEYLNMVLGSFAVRLQIELPARSTSGVNNINSDEVRALPINLPPVDEQAEIVRRVGNVAAFIQKIEAKVTAGTSRAEKLVQATLAKAFRGALVPTEAELAKREGHDYETAEALLARIKLGAPTNRRSRPALPDVQTFRTDLFEDRDVREHEEVQGIARDLGVLRGHWTTPPLATLTFDGTLAEAFKKTCNKNSPDRVVADPELHHAFVEQCRKLGLENPEFDLCFSLLNMRKGNDLKGLDSARRPVKGQWRYAAASEIAARVIHWRHGLTVDRIICQPKFVEEFEQVARSITPGYSSFEYRWAALGCRKVGQKAAQGVVDRLRWSDPVSFAALGDLPDAKGVYALRDRQHEADCIFVCGTENIREGIAAQTNLGSQNLFGDGLWRPDPQQLVWTYAKTSATAADRHGIVNKLVSQWSPILNVVRAA